MIRELLRDLARDPWTVLLTIGAIWCAASALFAAWLGWALWGRHRR